VEGLEFDSASSGVFAYRRKTYFEIAPV